MHFSPRPNPRSSPSPRRCPDRHRVRHSASPRSTCRSVRRRSLLRSPPAMSRISCASCVPCRPPASAEGKTNTATFYVTPDYLAIGSDEDYFLIPISPNTAQRIADALHCSLPTPKMVDEIYAAAEVKLAPSPIPPSAAMTTVPVFSNHNATVRAQRAEQLESAPARRAGRRAPKGRGDLGEAGVGPGEGGHLWLAPDQRRAHPAALPEAHRRLG